MDGFEGVWIVDEVALHTTITTITTVITVTTITTVITITTITCRVRHTSRVRLGLSFIPGCTKILFNIRGGMHKEC